MRAKAPAPDALEINVGLIGVGVVGSAVLDFFARAPIVLPVPGARLGGPAVARVRLWSAARRSRDSPKAAPSERIERVVSRDERGRPRFYYEAGSTGSGTGRRVRGPAWREIVRDERVDIVVELTGSPTAEAIIEEALWNGKCVVTANKAVLSRSGYELARLAQARGLILACEAAVGGAMPVVQTIAGCVGGRVTALLAIINGTTNFILTEMRQAARQGDAGAAYPAAVCAAIHQGLAEADPSADVLGEDARSKVIILAGLAFGVRLRPRDIYVRGIARRGAARAPGPRERAAFHACPAGSARPCPQVCGRDDHVSTQPILHTPDLHLLERLGYVPKLLAGAQMLTEGEPGRVAAWVQPAAVEAGHPLAGVNGSENACLLEVESPVEGAAPAPSSGSEPALSRAKGQAKRYAIALRGPGAGGPETASSVMADIQFCARQLAVRGHGDDRPSPLYMYGAGAFGRAQACQGAPALLSSGRLVAPFLLRVLGGDGVRAAAVASTLAQHGVRATPLQTGQIAPGYCYLRTGPTTVQAIEQGVEAVLREHGPASMPLDVLYLPALEGARWEERAA